MAPRSQPAQPLPGEQRYERLLASITDYAIYMTDIAGFIASWNPGAQRIKGYSAAEILGQHFSRFFTAEDQQRGLPELILQRARKHGRHEEEGWRVRKDGSRFWANAVMQPIIDQAGQVMGFAQVTRDITDRVAAQEALRESERRFRLLVEGVVDHAIYMLDPSGIVVNWNAGAQRLKGYTAAEIVGRHFSQFYTREDRAAGLPGKVIETAGREGRYESEGWRIRKDGSRFWASVVVDAIRNEEGRLEGFAKITRDVTERRAAQDALRDSERQFRLLIDNITDYALIMLDPNGVVASWNTGAERIKGYSASEIIGHHFSRFYPERDRASGLPARVLYTAHREGRFEAEGWRVRKDGGLFWANVVLHRIVDADGQLVGFAKITRDMTERREAQMALEEAQAQRAYAQKMDALGQLTGGVSHDFNNLLMIVSGHLSRLRKLSAGDARAEQSADAIATAVQRGSSLTRQLLTFSRRQPASESTVELGPRLESVRAMLGGITSTTISLTIYVAPDIWPVKVDAGELDLALVNLSLNARDAMPGGGMITIQAENVILSAGDTPARIEGEFVAIHVGDTGTGIPPDILSRVFDPFFTTKQGSRGSGLGLSQVWGLAHHAGGTVAIRSGLGEGTTVTVYLPRAVAQPASDQPTAGWKAAVGGRVLLVEDNPQVAEATAGLLEQLGYDITRVADVEAALSALETQGADLLVSDIMMPGDMDGLALARMVRQERPDMPIVLVTGYHQLAEKAAREFVLLRKPFDVSDLSHATTRAMTMAGLSSDNVVALRRPREP